MASLSAFYDNRATRWWGRVTASPEPAGVDAPWRIGPRGWGRTLARTLNGANADDYGIVASSIAFAAFLSILPLLSLVALAYGAIVPTQVVLGNVSALVGVLPHDAQGFVKRWLVHSLARRHGHGIALILSAALTLFSGRRVGRSLVRGINIASGIEQNRGPLATQAMALAIVASGALLLFAALISLSALAVIGHLVPGDVPGAATSFRLTLWGSLTLGPAIALLLTYRYAPARDAIAWRWALPGMLFANTAWLLATLAFRAYVTGIASYDSTYGSLSAIVVLLLWLMLSAYLLLFGAKLNTEAMRQAGIGAARETR